MQCFLESIPSTEGVYYLETNPEPVYSQGKPGVIKTVINSKEAKYSMMSDDSSFMDIVNRKLGEFEKNEPEIPTRESSLE